jgi:hypothetical protein
MAPTVRRYPLTAFFVLAFVFSWWPWPLYAVDLTPSPIIGFGPFVAAVLVLALTTGRSGVISVLRRMGRWRVHPAWYLVALASPIVMSGGATLLNVLLGARTPTPAELGAWTGLIPTFFLLLLVPGIGGAWEEPGRNRAGVVTLYRSCRPPTRPCRPASCWERSGPSGTYP